MKTIKVGLGTCGVSAGAQKTYEAIKNEIELQNIQAVLKETGCNGMCYREPLVEVIDEQMNSFVYGEVTPERAKTIMNSHVLADEPVAEWLVQSTKPTDDDSYFKKQNRIVLRNCGIIDPNSITEYMAVGGYEAIQKALKEYSPEEVIDIITRSGLRGRGGGGFLSGVKWKFCRDAAGDKKYIICNADEGDPGAFMDRSTLESDPHSVLEGMMICAYAIGAEEGYIYARAEYPKAVARMKHSIREALARGFLGKNIFGSPVSFSVKIKEGAGAFVCGEETALIASVEGKRGMPRFRPPFPANKGLWDKPTNINNVETYANIPWIITNGPEAFSAFGTDNSKGTKVFALAGKIQRGGLAEVPMGITINEIVFDIGGGVKEGKKFKAVQMGGPSGGCIPASMGNLQIDYQQINQTGAIMGSGGLVVMDESTCMVDMAKFFLRFTQDESCGKCTFCRIGTKRMLEILERITDGNGKEGDIELLRHLAYEIKNNTICGLGQTAPNPVLTTLKYFPEEYEAHIREKRCPAHSCSALLTYSIKADACKGCMACAKACPVEAITGEKKKAHEINTALCIKCGKCLETCKFDAVIKN
ncbi:NADH-quinone oxidoreductase subunit NuoF [Syntrophorhabdus aromaticivorans]|mgnify:CR=1 FL=1|uniref:NADH-quinone oxidoreductase subunit NuoF n=1 Tax=Syntrophorhabdus aromaticivorans TaxID=328301 RepID=A0A351U7D3_9BACT|nr:NADH-quinone oxidoreductase subunit NuoF [Syntrophorhabdus aromaticivorans]NLW36435.1 NADH-quinone oxidoreductase subunit NuoF [Syntrophorhabdus aromaticivorans]HBA55864.1 NADH-quinone oxidoreductase subunit NuoF [Syntrophorhabdus aromaticivorans]